MIVLKIIGWVLLGLLALIVLALCVRVRLQIEYSSENTSVVLGWLFLHFKLYPMSKKKKDKEKDETKKEEEPKEETQDNSDKEPKKKQDSFLKTLYDAEGVDGLISILQRIVSYTKTFLGNLLHGVVVDELYVNVRCTRSDAAQTAIYYGEVCAVLFPLLGSLISRCRTKKYDVNVYPDYIARFSDASFISSIHITPVYLIGITLSYVFKLIGGVLIGILFKIFGLNKKRT